MGTRIAKGLKLECSKILLCLRESALTPPLLLLLHFKVQLHHKTLSPSKITPPADKLEYEAVCGAVEASRCLVLGLLFTLLATLSSPLPESSHFAAVIKGKTEMQDAV
jgi:hypothetical protein